jgi:hypothetical protein
MVQNVQPRRSVQPPRRRGSVPTVLNGLNDLNESEATSAIEVGGGERIRTAASRFCRPLP